MTTTTLITDYLGRGLAAARPASPAVPSAGIAVYYATDTTVFSVWNGSAWVAFSAGAWTATAVTTVGANLAVTSGTIAVQNSPTFTLSGTVPAVVLANTGTVSTIPAGTILGLVGGDTMAARLNVFSYGGNPTFTGYRANGTQASPTAIASGSAIFALTGFGYGATGYSTAARVQFFFEATEAWSDTAQGTRARLLLTTTGGTVTAEVLRVQDSIIMVGQTVASGTNKLQITGGASIDSLQINAGTAITATGRGLSINSGTLGIGGSVPTLTGTAGGTLTFSPTEGIQDVVLNMPAAGGTVTLNAVPTATFQRAVLHIKQGATAGVLNLNTGFVFGTSGSPASFTITPTAAVTDDIATFSQDGTKVRVWALGQGFTF